VRYQFGREEEMQFGSPRGAECIYIKDGVMRDGCIVARKIRAYFDSGGLIRGFPATRRQMRRAPARPYTMSQRLWRIYLRLHQRTPATAMRGFGVTAMDFALECQMDKLAHLVGIDPMEFRIITLSRRRHEGAPARGQEHGADRMRPGRR